MLYFSILMLVARSGSGYLTYWTLGCAVASIGSIDATDPSSTKTSPISKC